ncbi:MAG: HutD family protein [Pseudomonadota bacterium]
MITHLSAAQFTLMPWANGKGTTVELLRVEREGRLILRLSRAMVVEDGNFSIFPGISRNLTVLSGPGFDLVGQGMHLSARLLHPVAFAGDVALRAVGVAEPCEDFNVMTAADLPPARVSVHPAGATAHGALLALAAGQIGGVAVAQYDVVLTADPLLADMPVIAVQAVGL